MLEVVSDEGFKICKGEAVVNRDDKDSHVKILEEVGELSGCSEASSVYAREVDEEREGGSVGGSIRRWEWG